MQTTSQDKLTIFDFSIENNGQGWYIVNDGVMGGLSEGRLIVENDMAVFKGEVSTDNNGGFTMVQNRFKAVKTSQFKAFVIKLKGDGKSYQFRVKEMGKVINLELNLINTSSIHMSINSQQVVTGKK